MLKLFFFTHPDLYNGVMVIIAYTEEHARDIIADYDAPNVYPSEEYVLHSVKNLSSGVKYYEYE